MTQTDKHLEKVPTKEPSEQLVPSSPRPVPVNFRSIYLDEILREKTIVFAVLVFATLLCLGKFGYELWLAGGAAKWAMGATMSSFAAWIVRQSLKEQTADAEAIFTHGDIAQGVVVREVLKTEPKRSVYEYQFTVADKSYPGEFHTAAELNIVRGDSVNVLYLQSDPNFNLLHDPTGYRRWKHETTPQEQIADETQQNENEG